LDVTSGYPIWECRSLGGEDCDYAWYKNQFCIFYGYVPVLVVFVAVVELLATRGTRELFFVIFVGFASLTNELIFKRIVAEGRPIGSCNVTCGMPSSHATFSIGFFVLMFCDTASRVNPMDVQGETTKGLKWMWELQVAFVKHPLSGPVTLSNSAFIWTVMQWGCILVPVPLTRVILHDHTLEQTTVGAALGILYALFFFFWVYKPFAKKMESNVNWKWPKGNCHLLKNNMELPWWLKEGKAVDGVQLRGTNTKSLVWAPCGSCEDSSDILVGLEDGSRGTGRIVLGQRLNVKGKKWTGIAWPTATMDETTSEGESDRELSD